MRKALRRTSRAVLNRDLRSGLVGAHLITSERIAKHTDRADFHNASKLVAATRAGALGLRFQSFLNTGFFSAVQVDLSFMIGCLLLVTKAARSPSFRNFVPKHYFSGYLW